MSWNCLQMKEFCVKVSFGFVRSQQTQDTNQHAFPFSYRASPYFLNVYISFLEIFLKKKSTEILHFQSVLDARTNYLLRNCS